LKILAIDASTGIELVAVSASGRTADRTAVGQKSHSMTLFTNIESAARDLGIKVKEIELIGVGVGPGSFTGIRIAVSAARMLAQALGVPIVGIKTHLIYACSAVCAVNENIMVAFDAKKERVFGALYRKTADQLAPAEIVEPGDYPIDYIIDKCAEEGKTLLAGDGCLKYLDIISKRLKNHELAVGFMPSGLTACMIAEALYRSNPAGCGDYNRILPLYARKSDAETAKDLKMKEAGAP
jgi:tRNA threonylcarbamoyladenosine biosynthesis protein TsaB